MMNHTPNKIIRKSKLINLKENQDIKKSTGGGPKSKKGFKWLLLGPHIEDMMGLKRLSRGG